MMKTLFVLLIGTCFAGVALAQQYKWVDQDGRTQYGDFPPPGVKATRLRGPSGPAAAPGAPSAPAAGVPLSPAEQEAAFRKRQQEGQKEAEKSAQAEREAAARKENCARAQAYLRTLETGQRVSSINSAGERIYLDDAQMASETAKARRGVQEACSPG